MSLVFGHEFIEVFGQPSAEARPQQFVVRPQEIKRAVRYDLCRRWAGGSEEVWFEIKAHVAIYGLPSPGLSLPCSTACALYQ